MTAKNGLAKLAVMEVKVRPVGITVVKFVVNVPRFLYTE